MFTMEMHIVLSIISAVLSIVSALAIGFVLGLILSNKVVKGGRNEY